MAIGPVDPYRNDPLREGRTASPAASESAEPQRQVPRERCMPGIVVVSTSVLCGKGWCASEGEVWERRRSRVHVRCRGGIVLRERVHVCAGSAATEMSLTVASSVVVVQTFVEILGKRKWKRLH